MLVKCGVLYRVNGAFSVARASFGSMKSENEAYQPRQSAFSESARKLDAPVGTRQTVELGNLNLNAS